MVRVVPLPTDTPFVIVLEYPVKAFDVCLADVFLHLVHLCVVLDEEFSLVVAFTVALFAELDFIHIFLYKGVLFSPELT